MKLRYLILLILIVISLGYIIGQFIPWAYLHPTIVDKTINLNDFYTRLITLTGTFATLLAVTVALFKEDIRKFWEFAFLQISFRDNNNLCEVLEEAKSDSINSVNKANKYETFIVVFNSGKLPAKNCELYLERLTFKNDTYTSLQEIQTTGIALDWWGKNDKTILIPATGKAHIGVFEITSPNSQPVSSEPNEKDGEQKLKPKIRFGNIESPITYEHGTWEATFILYSENAKPLEFLLTIKWNGSWEHRLSEMTKKCITIESKSRPR